MASEKLSSKTSIKFSLRFIFLIITLSGIVFAAIAPMIRSWPQAKQTASLLILATLVLTTFFIPFFFVFVRNRLENSAGELLVRIVGKQHIALRTTFFIVGCISYSSASLMLWGMIVFVDWNIGELTISVFLYLIFCWGLAALGIIIFCLFWWGGYVLEIRSEGIIHDTLSYKPWKSIKSFCWKGRFYWRGERLMLITEQETIVFSTRKSDKPFIEQCLRKYLPKRP